MDLRKHRAKVLKMLEQGKSRKDIAKEVKLTESQVQLIITAWATKAMLTKLQP